MAFAKLKIFIKCFPAGDRQIKIDHYRQLKGLQFGGAFSAKIL
jgi:hypothetical protein